MQRIRTTFKRSRTPTGAEMKTQSSLEVPKQVRSASFDEMQLEAKRNQEMLQAGDDKSLLKVPVNNQRSKSVDAGAASAEDPSAMYLEVPRRYVRRKSAGDKTPVFCIHCQYIDEIAKFHQSISVEDEVIPSDKSLESLSSLLGSSDSLSSLEECEENEEANQQESQEAKHEDTPVVQTCSITVTLSPNPPGEGEDILSGEAAFQGRRRSLTSPKLSRQSAFVLVDKNSSLENVTDNSSDRSDTVTQPGVTIRTDDGELKEGEFFQSPTDVIFDFKIDEPAEDVKELKIGGADGDVQHSSYVRDIFLQVPELKRDRAASVDSCFTKVSQSGKAEEVVVDSLEPPGNVALRSRSVDIVLPTDEQARYKALAMAHTTRMLQGKNDSDTEVPVSRSLRTIPDWSEDAFNGEHLWCSSTTSGDFCYVGEADCTKHGLRLKCAACKIIVHASCIPIIFEKANFLCRPTFRDVGIRQYREHTTVQHHWVHKRYEKGKCTNCGKSFQSKLSFTSKDIVALICSWCKSAYHNKENCFNIQKIGEECYLGPHQQITVPPSWIVKLPKSGNFKSSLKKSPVKKPAAKKKTNNNKEERETPTFVIKPIPSPSLKPVIVFINPRSGGNQGAKLMQKFQWLLNPRQVFDLSQGGPNFGLELFRKVMNLRVLACGGDGTVGWILSIIDQVKFPKPPPVGILPLGTGNDLARALGWGGGYTDEPIATILNNVAESEITLLDRWELKVEKNLEVEAEKVGKDNLPLNVLNNYFSLGVDAHIALEFHEAREAHPERFTSRLKNKMFYGQMGGKDLLKRKWKDLSGFVKLECDGKDLTSKLKEHKVHAIVFLNIPSYGGGTHPWNRTSGGIEPAIDDGIIEVVGLTTYQLPLLQAGGHGTCITQCKEARIVTTTTIPMQVDGEACRLSPSIITLSLYNKASMLMKRKRGQAPTPQTTLENVKVSVQKIVMNDYEHNHHDRELLAQSAIEIGTLEVSPGTDLEQIRTMINQFENECAAPRLTQDWCFIDSCTAERFFRIDRAQEQLHYLADIAVDILYVLDPEGSTSASDDDLQTASNTLSSASATAPECSDEEWMMKPRANGAANVKPQVPTISTPMDNGTKNGRKTQDEAICRSKSAEGISELKHEDKNSKPSQNLRIIKSPSAGTGISNLLEKTSENIIKAAKAGDLKYLKELYRQGYSLLSIDSAGRTALHHAAKRGHKDIVQYLITFAPPTLLNMADNDRGRTALHLAAAYKQRNICCMLISGGASPTKKDREGSTPRQLALQAEDTELADYLRNQERFQHRSEDLETMV